MPQCWAVCPQPTAGQRHRKRHNVPQGAALPRAGGQRPPVSPLRPSCRCRFRRTSPRLWGRPCTQPERRMWWPPLLEKCVSTNHGQPDGDVDEGTLQRTGSVPVRVQSENRKQQGPARLLPTGGIAFSSGKTSILLLCFFSLLEAPPPPDYQG